MLRAVLSVLGALIVVHGVAGAQETGDLRQEILSSQRRLEEIRNERALLQSEMEGLRSRVRDVSSELRNIERQLSASRSVLAEIDFQVDATSLRVQETTADLISTQGTLQTRGIVLNRRLRDIYKRGPLHTLRVLLGAESFADLLNRYRYLRLMAISDRSLFEGIKLLELALIQQNRELEQTLSELTRLRQDRVGEQAELVQVEEERQRTLASFRSRESQTQDRLTQLEADEERLTGLISDLEGRRREAERRAASAGRVEEAPAAMTSGDAGTLDWPVDGEVIYRFGRERRPNGTVLRWNGLGIQAAPGEPVRAVRDGTVVLAGPFEGYGPTVVVSHGDGFYTLYLYLEEIGVVDGREVQAGQVVGTVGGAGTPEGPHIEFQIRAPVAGGSPQARDPLQWLKTRPSGP